MLRSGVGRESRRSMPVRLPFESRTTLTASSLLGNCHTSILLDIAQLAAVSQLRAWLHPLAVQKRAACRPKACRLPSLKSVSPCAPLVPPPNTKRPVIQPRPAVQPFVRKSRPLVFWPSPPIGLSGAYATVRPKVSLNKAASVPQAMRRRRVLINERRGTWLTPNRLLLPPSRVA